jgi:hypothetical protein
MGRRSLLVQGLEGRPTGVVVHDPGLDMSDLRPDGEAVEDEVAQCIGVGKADVEEEVVGARDVVQLDHLRHRERRLAEGVDVGAGVRPDTDRHDRLEAPSERAPVDVCMEATEDAAGVQRSHPLEAAGGSEADERGEVLVRDPRILLESLDEGPVDSVETLFRH